MQNFFSTVAARVLETAEKLVADENDSAVSEVELQPAEIEFAEVLCPPLSLVAKLLLLRGTRVATLCLAMHI